MMARRHNSRPQSSSKDGPNDGHHLLESPPLSQRKSPNISAVTWRSMMIRKDTNSIQKIKHVLGLVMIVVVVSLLNNSRGQQHHVLSERYDANDNSAAETELLQALYDLPLPTTQKELDDLNDELAGVEPKFILQWAHHTLLAGNHNNLRTQETNGWNSHPLVQVTSFGPTGLVILDQLYKCNYLLDTVPVITMDTLHLFKESYAFYDTVQSHYNSTLHLIISNPVHIAHPPELDGDSVFKGFISSKTEFQDVYSPTLWKTDPRYYTKVTKVDPLQQKLEEWQTIMWITGRRRSQGGEREKLNVLEFDSFRPDGDNRRVRSEEDNNDNPFHSSKGRWKLNPLAYWSYDQVWNYIKANEVPYNPLYDQGYTSIGDEMTSILPKKSHVGDAIYERSGRFVDLNRTECGLHSHLQKIETLKKQNEEAGEEWTVPELTCEKCIDLNEDTFLETVDKNNLRDDSLLLVEFYSPFCGSCQEFAPVLNRLADYQVPNTIVARFDITEQNIPKYNNQELFQVESTPTLYLVGYSPSIYAEMYSGKHEFDAILQWLTKKRNSR